MYMNKNDMVMNKVLIVMLCLMAYFQGHTQKNYISGYIVKMEGDTVKGFVNYSNWDVNPDKVEFKIGENEKPTLFSPDDIAGFGVANEIYASAKVQTEISPIDIQKINFNKEFETQYETAFLQALVVGHKSLFLYKNKEGRYYYYIKENTKFELLLYKKYLVAQDAKRLIRENKFFVSQLMSYLSDCSSTHTKLKNIEYKKESLTKLMEHYYQCTSTDATFVRKSESAKFEYGVLVGGTLTSLSYRSRFLPYLENAGFKPSLSPSVGGFLELILAKNQNKWSFYNELLFTSYNVKGSYLDYKNDNEYSNYNPEIGYLHININNLIRYKYKVGNSSIFLNGGVATALSLKETNNNKVETKFFGSQKVEEKKVLDETRKYDIGLCVGGGLLYKKYSVELRYKQGNGNSIYPILNSNTRTIYLLLGYRF